GIWPSLKYQAFKALVSTKIQRYFGLDLGFDRALFWEAKRASSTRLDTASKPPSARTSVRAVPLFSSAETTSWRVSGKIQPVAGLTSTIQSLLLKHRFQR